MHKAITIPRYLIYKAAFALTFLLSCHTYANGPAYGVEQNCKKLVDKGVALGKNGDFPAAIEYLVKAETLSEKYKLDPKKLIDIKMALANCYSGLSNFGEALGYYKEAVNIAKLYPGLANEYRSTLINIGRLYFLEREPTQALPYYKKAYDISTGSKDEYFKILSAINMGLCYNMLNKPKTAQYYFKEVKDIPIGGDLKNLWEVSYAEAFFLEGRLIESERMLIGILEKFEKDFKINENSLDGATYTNALELKVRILSRRNEPDRAIQYANKGLKASNQVTKKDFYDLLSKLYLQKKDATTALKYKDSLILAKDSIASLINRGLFETNKVKLKVQEYQGELKYNKEKYDSERKLLYSIIMAITALVTVTILVLRQRKLVADRNKQAALLALEKEKNENHILERRILDREIQSQIEEEHLKEEIQVRNRELAAKALFLSGRNELIEEIVTAIGEHPKLSKVPSLAKNVAELKNHLRSDDEWDSFIIHFEEVNPGFINRLKQKYPSFTSNDVRFIVYLYMNLSLKEIASMLHITFDSCRKRKERITAKMEIPENSDIYSYISSI